MLTGIIKATRAHYAALQHNPAADRVALDYEVVGHTAGTIWVKIGWPNSGWRKREMTKLINRLRAMYPEAREISAEYRGAHSKTPMFDGQKYLQRARRLKEIGARCNCGADYDDQTHKSWCTNG